MIPVSDVMPSSAVSSTRPRDGDVDTVPARTARIARVAEEHNVTSHRICSRARRNTAASVDPGDVGGIEEDCHVGCSRLGIVGVRGSTRRGRPGHERPDGTPCSSLDPPPRRSADGA